MSVVILLGSAAIFEPAFTTILATRCNAIRRTMPFEVSEQNREMLMKGVVSIPFIMRQESVLLNRNRCYTSRYTLISDTSIFAYFSTALCDMAVRRLAALELKRVLLVVASAKKKSTILIFAL